MHKDKSARLILNNGAVFEGTSFGAEISSAGEVVFNTAMVGYPESLTDPSYSGQILVITFPMIGNYGVPGDSSDNGLSDFFESEKIHLKGVIIQDYSHDYSHWNAKKSLSQWLKEHNIPAIYGIDTRAITKIIRESGAMLGKIVLENQEEPDFYDPGTENLVEQASCKEVHEYNKDGKKTVVMVDCGTKNNIIRELLKQDVHVIRVPWDYDFTTIDYDGLFISNGPGSPDYCEATIKNIQKAIEIDKPIFGICMGNQLLAKAAGAKVFKMKYGNRSHNQPVREVGTNTCYITSQNHGYAVDTKTLEKDWVPYFENMNDGTNEGIKHTSKPFFSVQFHPEAASGPEDTTFFFKKFVDLL